MDAELPKRLYEQGTEPQVDKINNSCKPSILDFLREKMPDEYNTVKRDPVFAPVFAIHENHLGFSATLVHSMMCRQLLTAKKYELWFVFGGRPLRFSMQEYHAVTGLKCEDDGNYDLQNFVDDDGFWSKLLKRGSKISILSIKKSHIKNIHRWTRMDRLRLVYLCVIAGVLMAKDEKVCISDEHIKLVMDFDKLRAYPWGLRSFDYLVQSIINTRVKLSQPKSYVLRGFNYAFQVWIMEAIPDIGTMLGTKFNEFDIVSPRCSNWRVTKSLSSDQIISLENSFGAKMCCVKLLALYVLVCLDI